VRKKDVSKSLTLKNAGLLQPKFGSNMDQPSHLATFLNTIFNLIVGFVHIWHNNPAFFRVQANLDTNIRSFSYSYNCFEDHLWKDATLQGTWSPL